MHHHMVWGVDDGAKGPEETRDMLLEAARNGVSVISATAHAIPGERPFPLERYRKHLAAARDFCREMEVSLHLTEGAEIFYHHSAARLLGEGRIPTLNGTRNILVEFAPGETAEHITDAVRRLSNEGYTVVIAHAARHGALRRTERIGALRWEYGAVIQINANTLIRPSGFLLRRWVRTMLEQDLADVAASDAHNASARPCRMKECYETLIRERGQAAADRLCRDTPRRLLGLGPG